MDIDFAHYLVAGTDEAGRGPLAGPVVAAAVILNPDQVIEGLTDSKKISAKKRACLFEEIQSKALSYAIGHATVEEIDTLNILQASLLAMQRAVEGLSLMPKFVLVDGNHAPDLPMLIDTVIQGDLYIPEISAASILAKVTRDEEMIALHQQYPQYGFDEHKGYPTKQHVELLQKFGATPMHRKSFGPVKKLLSHSD